MHEPASTAERDGRMPRARGSSSPQHDRAKNLARAAQLLLERELRELYLRAREAAASAPAGSRDA